MRKPKLPLIRSKGSTYLSRDLKDNVEYYCMMLIPLALIFVFSYLPMIGIVIAFQNYSVGKPFFGKGVEWVGLQHFKTFVTSYYFPRILRNTLLMNIMCLVFGFWIPIVFAITLNEIRNSKFRKFTQTVSYMPNFISTVVVVGMFLSFIADDGIITQLLRLLGMEAKSLNTSQAAFPWYYTLLNIWKSFGWNSILFLASISSIDPTLYESADLDGATRMQKIRYITFPSMLPIITIQLIFAMGGMLGSNSDMILLLYNSAVLETADVIGTYVYRETLMGGMYSYGTAAGLLMGLFSFTLVYIANRTARKHLDYSIW